MTPPQQPESLDPSNWDEMRSLGHRMVDDAIAYLRTVRERPAWQAVPERTRTLLGAPARASPGRHLLPEWPSGFLYFKSELYSALIAVVGIADRYRLVHKIGDGRSPAVHAILVTGPTSLTP